eukprot:1172725-Prorocentrum_minimum.AAC.2
MTNKSRLNVASRRKQTTKNPPKNRPASGCGGLPAPRGCRPGRPCRGCGGARPALPPGARPAAGSPPPASAARLTAAAASRTSPRSSRPCRENQTQPDHQRR